MKNFPGFWCDEEVEDNEGSMMEIEDLLPKVCYVSVTFLFSDLSIFLL